MQLLVGAGSGMWAAGNPGAMYVVHTAAQRGDLALVQYVLHELQHLGCQVDAATLEYAAQGGCEMLLEWLVREHPARCCLEGASPYVPAAMTSSRGSLLALRRLGVPWGPLRRTRSPGQWMSTAQCQCCVGWWSRGRWRRWRRRCTAATARVTMYG